MSNLVRSEQGQALNKQTSNPFLTQFRDKLALQLGKASNLQPSEWISQYTSFLDPTRGTTHPFSFEKHQFQKQIVDDTSRQLCLMKCCQIGATEVFVRLALELVANRGYQTILTQPNFDASRNFSKTRIQPVIDDSPKLSALTTDTNSVNLKKIGNAFLHVKYTKGAEQHALSTPADVRISDEVDQSDQSNLKLFQSRLEASIVRMTRDFGTPTIPRFGISNIYESSYQYKYMIKCPHCGEWNNPSVLNLMGFMQDAFAEGLPDFPTIYKDALDALAPSVYIGCVKCGKSLEYADRLLIPRTSAKLSPVEPKYEWVAVKSDTAQNGRMAGYNINQVGTGMKTGRMIVESMSAYERIRDVYNQLLGEPFIPVQDQLLETDIKITNEISPPMCVMGVDFGKKTYISLYFYDSVEKLGFLFKAFEEPLFTSTNEDYVTEQIISIGKKYNALVAVVDAMPYQNAVNKLKNNAPFPVFDCYLTDREHSVFKVDFKKQTVRGGRTSAIDELLADFKHEKDKITAGCGGLRELAVAHLTSFLKVVRKDGSYYYPKIGDDHIGFATMYAKKAALLVEKHYDLIMSLDTYSGAGLDLEFKNVEMKF